MIAAQRTNIAWSATVAVADAVRRLRAEGIDVVDLGGGDPDFPTPPHIIEAAHQAMLRGDTHYVDSAGVHELRVLIAEKLRRENQVDVAPEAVLVTPGGKAALYAAISAYVELGVDVLVAEPAWVSYRAMVQSAAGRIQPIHLSAENNFELSRSALEAAVTPATRVIIVNSPCNPTGRVLTNRELSVIAEVALAHDLLVVSDEIYEHLTYDNHRHVSIASFPHMKKRTLVVNGFSKAWAMTGWRLGYIAGPVELLKPVRLLHGHMVTCAASFAQAGGIAALRGPLTSVHEMVSAWSRRRVRLVEAVNRMPGLQCQLPEGAFYAFVDVRKTGLDSTSFAKRLLETVHLAVTPGNAFGNAGEGYVRLSYAQSDAEIERAIARLSRFVATPSLMSMEPK